MKLVQAKPVRLYCKHCDEALSLPQNGNIKLHQELQCPIDGFEVLYFTAGVRGKSYVFCPYCYNHPPFPDMFRKGGGPSMSSMSSMMSGCNRCSHPTCPHGRNAHGVSACVECDSGVLVLDPASMPKWKLVCNNCDVIVRIFEDAAKVATVGEDSCCPECQAQLLRVEYKEGKSKLADDKLVSEGCIFCDPELFRLVEKHHAAVFMLRHANRRIKVAPGKVGVGGGGRRGRGGGGRRGPKDKMSQLAAYFV